MTDRPSTSNAIRKGVLFCPVCGHESAADGDWIVRERSDRTAYECPECAATITTRPRFESAPIDAA